MNAAGNLTSTVETCNSFTILAHDRPIHIDLQATHAIVNDRRDNCHKEFLSLDCRAWNNVVVELLATACWAACIIPRLAMRIGWPRATIRILLMLLRCIVVILVRFLKHG